MDTDQTGLSQPERKLVKKQQASFGGWSPLLPDNERILVQKLRYR